MKNKFKAAGIVNLVMGLLLLLGILVPITLLYVLMFLSSGSTDESVGIAFIMTLLGIALIFALSGTVAYSIFMIIMGAKMVSKKEKSSTLRVMIGINATIKLLAAYSGIYGVFSLSLVSAGGEFIVVAVIFAVSAIMDIVALAKKER